MQRGFTDSAEMLPRKVCFVCTPAHGAAGTAAVAFYGCVGLWAECQRQRSAGTLRAKLDSTAYGRILAIMHTIKLVAEAKRIAGLLSHGQKQWLEIGMLLMQEPQLLLLDEPVAGMTDDETMRSAELFESLAGDYTLVVVEHDMDFVARIADRVTVLHEGRVLAEGSMQHVQQDEQVIEVFLGR
jgi:urea transport system ATP-binding protein